jgi:hypothetical protein
VAVVLAKPRGLDSATRLWSPNSPAVVEGRIVLERVNTMRGAVTKP